MVMGFWVWPGPYKMCPRALHLSLLLIRKTSKKTKIDNILRDNLNQILTQIDLFQNGDCPAKSRHSVQIFRACEHKTLMPAPYFICISRDEKIIQTLSIGRKFSFPYVYIWSVVPKCKLVLKNSSLVLFGFSIFVVETKIFRVIISQLL